MHKNTKIIFVPFVPFVANYETKWRKLSFFNEAPTSHSQAKVPT